MARSTRNASARDARAAEQGFLGESNVKVARRTYADLYGPTDGDRVRLGDTGLLVEIEKDFARYGEEVVFGGGKVDSGRPGAVAGNARPPARPTS